jgi:hypothetical protein
LPEPAPSVALVPLVSVELLADMGVSLDDVEATSDVVEAD